MRKTTWMKMISIPLALAALFACSDGNSSAPAAIDGAGKHAVAVGYTNWVQQHWVEYKKANGGSADISSGTSCSQCHGTDLSGGTAKVSCFSATFIDSSGATLTCHPNHTLGHPSSWVDPSSAGFHGAATFNGSAVKGSAVLGETCGLCHSTSQNILLVGSAPSCLSTDPKYGIACHASSPALNSQGCVSCHSAAPSGPTGTVAPNRSGAHAAHLGLGVGCKTCHRNGGTGTDKHAAGNGLAFLNLSTGYKAQTGSFAYAGGKCSAVACHGGQQTPNWRTGETIDVAQDCTGCHAAANAALPQYNSYASGKHAFHLAGPNGFTITCISCHDADLLTSHFAGLATSAFEGDPATTLRADIQYVKSTGNCTAACHQFAPGFYLWNL